MPEWKNRCLGFALKYFSKEQKKKDRFFFFKCGKILRNVKSGEFSLLLLMSEYFCDKIFSSKAKKKESGQEVW